MRPNYEKRGSVPKRRRPAPFNPRNAAVWRDDGLDDDDFELVERNGNLTLTRERWHEVQGG